MDPEILIGTSSSPPVKKSKPNPEILMGTSSSSKPNPEIVKPNPDVDLDDDSDEICVMGDYSPWWGDDYRRITPEEYERYCSMVKASEGFDVDDFPDVDMANMIQPYDFNSLDYHIKRLTSYAMLALDDYNSKQQQHGDKLFEFVKVNSQVTVFIDYFITFEAKQLDSPIQVFQAKVKYGMEDNISLFFCRLKPLSPTLPR